MKIDKIIFAVDDNPLYSGFWEIQSWFCKNYLQIQPVLFHITDVETDFIQDGYGIVKKIDKKNYEGLPTSFLSQIIRMWGTKYFSEQVCIMGDIDLFFLDKKYLHETIQNYDDDSIVLYDSDAYDIEREDCDSHWFCKDRYILSWVTAKGKIFDKILNTNRSLSEYAYELASMDLGWDTDEVYFGRRLNNLQDNLKIEKLKRDRIKPFITRDRIERHNFQTKLELQNEVEAQKKYGTYDKELLKNGYYKDMHCPRPFHVYKKEILEIINNFTMDEKNDFNRLGTIHKTDKVLHHRYDRIYPKFMEELRQKPIKLFEIGCGEKYASFNMWKDYFPLGQIYCMDIGEEIYTDRGIVFKGDQTKIEDLEKMINVVGYCDIIIDDGSHIPKHQIETFIFLFEKMVKPGGVYIIEDIECNYWRPDADLYGYKIGKENVVDYFLSTPHKINSEFSNLKNHHHISSITHSKNCIILTKMNEEEFNEYGRDYRFKHLL